MREEERAAVRRRGQHQEGGASLVEFALVVPILAMFLFGIVQFGIAYDMKQSVNSAAREGARRAALPVSTVLVISDAVENAFDGLVDDGTLTTKITIDGTEFLLPTDTPCKGHEGETVVVEVSVSHTFTVPFVGTFDRPLKGRGEFRCERPA